MALSEANNLWNQKALALAEKDRQRNRIQQLDKIISLSTQHPSEVENPNDVSFEEFYQSRLAGIVARNRTDYALQRAGHALLKPVYQIQFAFYQIAGAQV